MGAIAFFDFDGTITRKDSLLHFTSFAVGKLKFYLGLIVLAPMLLAYLLKIISNDRAKEMFIGFYFKGMDYHRFKEIATNYSETRIDKIIKVEARKKIKWHQENGHKTVVVSASMEDWLSDWCSKNDLDLIATRLEVLDGKLTGKFAGKNCHGMEKVNRIKERYTLSDYELIYAYGDSTGDTEMLDMAHIKNDW